MPRWGEIFDFVKILHFGINITAMTLQAIYRVWRDMAPSFLILEIVGKSDKVYLDNLSIIPQKGNFI